MRSYPGGIRHDYKDSAPGVRALNPRGLSWFAIGLVLPIVFVALLLVSEPNESMVPSGTEPTALDGDSLAPTSLDAASLDPASLDPASLDPASLDPASLDSAPLDATALALAAPLADEPPAAAPFVAESLRPERSLRLAVLTAPGDRVALELPPPATTALPGNRLPGPEELERSALLEQGDLLDLVVRSGDSLDQLFRRNDLSISDLAQMLELPDARRHLSSIRPGDEFEIIHDGERVLSLSREISESQRLWIKRDGEGYVAEVIDLETQLRTAGAHGVIESSLFEAGSAAGISDAVTMAMAERFTWDVDFNLDVRVGDSFTVIYEEIWRDGVKLRDGGIVAAEFVNRGEVFRVARFTDPAGDSEYYTPDGFNVRKAFMRNPIPIVRVSSNFNPNRRHPILNVIRAHRGVDYAAPTGTPVYASGDGRIVARGANGSYGNRVEIQHGGNVTTLYAHLSRYGNHGVGARVKQGDVIGYVGMTGGATGPHLHYEYRINGVHQNPRTVDLPPADPIPSQYRQDFDALTARLWHQLDLYEGALLAANGD